MKLFNKFEYYEQSVQNPPYEVDFVLKEYFRFRKKKPKLLREDFCGTAAISTEWVKRQPDHKALSVDLDPEPLAYNKEVHQNNLTVDQKSRLKIVQANVLNLSSKADVTIAYNFSYFIFKERKKLLEYFKSVKKNLKPGGVFFLDAFGGPESFQTVCDKKNHGPFTYYWDCKEFNLLTNDCTFAIHFERKGENIRRNVFLYHWRLWGIAEIAI